MSWLRHVGWIAIVFVTLAIAILPNAISAPEPERALVVDRALLVSGTGPGIEVSLPHAIQPAAGNALTVRYIVDIDLPSVPDEGVHLLVPLLNRRTLLMIDGETIFDSGSRTLLMGPAVSTTSLVRLPRRALTAGHNQLTLAIEAGPFIAPIYMSRLYVGTEAELAPAFKWRTAVDQLRVVSLAAQAMLAGGLIFAFFFRPRDMLLSWLAALEAVTITVTIGMFTGFQPVMQTLLPYIVTLVPAYGLLCVAVALALLGKRPPRTLQVFTIAITLLLLGAAAIGTHSVRTVVAGVGLFFVIAGTVGSTAIFAWSVFKRDNVDARFMLGPSFLLAFYLLRDSYVLATLPAHPLNNLSPPIGLVYVAAIIAVLMRRMGSSFEQLDRSNETLALRLAEREAELAAIAKLEQAEAARRVREHERQRLTHDLHDGLSGHLASIIALSERAEAKPIEAAAREALNDLRLVIYSLDLGDSDLPLALANFRERLTPQLQRLGVELEWSMANLPEISGVTPGNALTVLRILQEAITNGLRHGPARRFTIKGSISADGLASIVVENDGSPFVAGRGGRGLDNMRRRAEQLRATLEVAAFDRGTRITLGLPLRLADIEA